MKLTVTVETKSHRRTDGLARSMRKVDVAGLTASSFVEVYLMIKDQARIGKSIEVLVAKTALARRDIAIKLDREIIGRSRQGHRSAKNQSGPPG